MATMAAVATKVGLRPWTSPNRPNSNVPTKAPTKTTAIKDDACLWVKFHSTWTATDKKLNNKISMASDAEQRPTAINMRR